MKVRKNHLERRTKKQSIEKIVTSLYSALKCKCKCSFVWAYYLLLHAQLKPVWELCGGREKTDIYFIWFIASNKHMVAYVSLNNFSHTEEGYEYFFFSVSSALLLFFLHSLLICWSIENSPILCVISSNKWENVVNHSLMHSLRVLIEFNPWVHIMDPTWSISTSHCQYYHEKSSHKHSAFDLSIYCSHLRTITNFKWHLFWKIVSNLSSLLTGNNRNVCT